jgi:hypothetical protein
MRDYCGTPPCVRENRGYGAYSVVWGTLSQPALDFIRELCYTPDESGRWVKEVNQHWLSLLTWEGVAYWFMDDGNRGAALSFSTHGFTKEQSELLAAWLTERGVEATASPVRKGPKIYWNVRLSLDASYALRTAIEPYVIPSMHYKLEALPEIIMVTCSCCGKQFRAKQMQRGADLISCGKPECKAHQHRQTIARLEAALTPDQREAARVERNTKTRQRYHANLEKSRKATREKMQRARLEKGDELRAARRARRKALKGTPEYEAKLKEERRRYYERLKAEPVRFQRMSEAKRQRKKRTS